MNSEDIKKALECCSNPSINSCKNCPYNNNGEFSCCDGEMCKDALNLITEQEKEIKRLKAENKKYLDSIESVQAGRCRLICPLTEQAVKQAKIDVLNELKDKMFEREYMGVKYKERIFYESEINDMIAEVQNAEDKS